MLDIQCATQDKVGLKAEALARWILKITYGYINPPQKEINRIKNELQKIELFENSSNTTISKNFRSGIAAQKL
jgi:hypothetical protein